MLRFKLEYLRYLVADLHVIRRVSSDDYRLT